MIERPRRRKSTLAATGVLAACVLYVVSSIIDPLDGVDHTPLGIAEIGHIHLETAETTIGEIGETTMIVETAEMTTAMTVVMIAMTGEIVTIEDRDLQGGIRVHAQHTLGL